MNKRLVRYFIALCLLINLVLSSYILTFKILSYKIIYLFYC